MEILKIKKKIKKKIKINNISDLTNSSKNDISFFNSLKYFELLKKSNAKYVITSQKYNKIASKYCKTIVVNHVLKSVALICKVFYPNSLDDAVDLSVCNPLQKNFKKVKFGINVLIGKNVKIGVNSIIGHNTIIESNVKIGSNCIIGNNVLIKNSIIGKNVRIWELPPSLFYMFVQWTAPSLKAPRWRIGQMLILGVPRSTGASWTPLEEGGRGAFVGTSGPLGESRDLPPPSEGL